MKSYQKILVVQIGRIGDVILMTPFLRELKQRFPTSELHFLSGRNNKTVVERIPYIDKIHVYEKGLTGAISIIKKLKKESYDLWIDAKDHKSGESRYFAKLVGVPERIGFNDPEKKTEVFTLAVPSATEQFDLHMIDRNLNVLTLLGFEPPYNRKLELVSNSETDERFHDFMMEIGLSEFYLINISASKANRYWDLGKWLEFLDNFKHHQFLISGDPKDINLIKELLDKRSNAFYFQTNSIIDVYSIVKAASMVISPDTSIIHIASAFNKPVIGLFANLAWNIKKFHPTSDLNKLLINSGTDESIREISTEELTLAFEEMLIEINA